MGPMAVPPVQELRIRLPDVELRGWCRGSGPPLVLLHGGPGCYDYFSGTPLVEWLAERHAVYTYDQRGCRHSLSEGPFTLAANLADLEALRRHLGVERLDLLGHSAGAILAVHFAARHPERVARLTLLSPAGLRPGWRPLFDAALRERFTPPQAAAIHRMDRLILRTRDQAAREELYRQRFNLALPAYVSPAYRGPPPRMEYYRRAVNVRVMADIQATYDDPRWEAGLRGFGGPVAVLHGRDDPIPWSVVEDLVDLLPQAEIHPLERCGHFPWLETPEACRAALFAFLDGP